MKNFIEANLQAAVRNCLGQLPVLAFELILVADRPTTCDNAPALRPMQVISSPMREKPAFVPRRTEQILPDNRNSRGKTMS
jgi:hypothetical protein